MPGGQLRAAKTLLGIVESRSGSQGQRRVHLGNCGQARIDEWRSLVVLHKCKQPFGFAVVLGTGHWGTPARLPMAAQATSACCMKAAQSSAMARE